MIEVVGGILIRNNRILLGLRAPHKTYPGCWDFFGGHLEIGECPWAALCRELNEELGIDAPQGTWLKDFDFSNPAEGASRLHVFRIVAWTGEPRIADDEHTELQWFTSEEAQSLPNLPSPDYRSLFGGLGLAA